MANILAPHPSPAPPSPNPPAAVGNRAAHALANEEYRAVDPVRLTVPLLDDLQDLICVICKKLPFQPLQTPCEHYYCSSDGCPNGWDRHTTPECPQCNAPVTRPLSAAPRMVKNMVDALQIRCKHNQKHIVTLGQLQNHERTECSDTKVACPKGCGTLVARCELESHIGHCEKGHSDKHSIPKLKFPKECSDVSKDSVPCTCCGSPISQQTHTEFFESNHLLTEMALKQIAFQEAAAAHQERQERSIAGASHTVPHIICLTLSHHLPLAIYLSHHISLAIYLLHGVPHRPPCEHCAATASNGTAARGFDCSVGPDFGGPTASGRTKRILCCRPECKQMQARRLLDTGLHGWRVQSHSEWMQRGRLFSCQLYDCRLHSPG